MTEPRVTTERRNRYPPRLYRSATSSETLCSSTEVSALSKSHSTRCSVNKAAKLRASACALSDALPSSATLRSTREVARLADPAGSILLGRHRRTHSRGPAQRRGARRGVERATGRTARHVAYYDCPSGWTGRQLLDRRGRVSARPPDAGVEPREPDPGQTGWSSRAHALFSRVAARGEFLSDFLTHSGIEAALLAGERAGWTCGSAAPRRPGA